MRGRLHRLLFSVMGPPQLGDLAAPDTSEPRVELCAKCGRPYDEHELVRGPRFTTTRCPQD